MPYSKIYNEKSKLNSLINQAKLSKGHLKFVK